MPTGLKFVIVLNIIFTALIGVLAFGIGGGIELVVFPPNLPLESPQAVPIAAADAVQATVNRPEQLGLAADAFDFAARRWEVRPDGSLRIYDDPRDLAVAVDSALPDTFPGVPTHQVETIQHP
ncbi:MAG: hypothetical protein U1E63_06860 [Burkholderiales bacterium]